MTLLIHSMAEFGDIILAALAIADARDVVEIGCEFGGMSATLAGYVDARDGTLTSVDPAPKPEFLDWLAGNPHVRHVAEMSLPALPSLTADAWIVDGDHNWYTVYNELHGIRAACDRAGKPLLAFLHDVDWPCGRRDFYYAPATIPPEFRHPHSFDGGVSIDWDGVRDHQGFRGAGGFALATHEGGPRNGVLTGIEDFIDDCAQGGRELLYAQVPAVFGLGVLFDKSADWAGAMADHLVPWHGNRLLATLERNRLRNYLAVIDWQDRDAARAA